MYYDPKINYSCLALSAFCITGVIFGLNGIQERKRLYESINPSSLDHEKQSKMLKVIFGKTPLYQRITLGLASVLFMTPLMIHFIAKWNNPEKVFADQISYCAKSNAIDFSEDKSDLDKCYLAYQCQQIESFLKCSGLHNNDLLDEEIHSKIRKAMIYLHPDKNKNQNSESILNLNPYIEWFKKKMISACKRDDFQQECNVQKEKVVKDRLQIWAKQQFPGHTDFIIYKVGKEIECLIGERVQSELTQGEYCVQVNIIREKLKKGTEQLREAFMNLKKKPQE